MRRGDLALLYVAGVLAPGKYYLRQAPARGVLMLHAPPDVSLRALEFSLSGNPHSADLLAALLRATLAKGDVDGAAQAFRRLRALVPNTPSVRAICADDPVCDIKFIRTE
jgi:Flp pilus assembly protein TadD